MHNPFLPTLRRSDAHTASRISIPGQREALKQSSIVNRKSEMGGWPFWAQVVAKFRQPQDIGLGDTIVHLIGDTRSERFKQWFARKFGRSCGCTDRQRWLNRRFPYSPSTSSNFAP